MDQILHNGLRSSIYYFIPVQPNYSLVPQNFIARQNDSSEFDPGMPLKLHVKVKQIEVGTMLARSNQVLKQAEYSAQH